MMPKVIKRIGIIFVALLLILATSGYSIYRHYCYCAGKTSASLFLEDKCDHHVKATAASCCATKPSVANCCAAESAKAKAEKHIHSGKCCETSLIFLKISDTFNQSFEKISFKFITGFIQLLISADLQCDPQIEPAEKIYYADISPPLFGKELLYSLHQLKLAPEIS